MKNANEIIEDAKNNNLSNDYSLLEIHLYCCIDQILKMYANRQISKESANRYKMLAIKKYEDMQKQYEFEKTIFQDHIKASNETCGLRIELRKQWKDETQEITIERLAQMLNLAISILDKTYKGEF